MKYNRAKIKKSSLRTYNTHCTLYDVTAIFVLSKKKKKTLIHQQTKQAVSKS